MNDRRTRQRPLQRMRTLLPCRKQLAALFDDGDHKPATEATDLQIVFDRTANETALADGTPLRLRPIIPQDKDNLQAAMSRLSAEARHRRFMSAVSELSPDALRHFTEIDYEDHFALVALAVDRDPPLAIGVARYIRDPDEPHIAEPAVTVVDDYQGRGLGRLLLGKIMSDAMSNGITRFHATLLADNMAMKELFAQQNAEFGHEGLGVLSAEFALPPDVDSRMDLTQRLARHARKNAVTDSRRDASGRCGA